MRPIRLVLQNYFRSCREIADHITSSDAPSLIQTGYFAGHGYKDSYIKFSSGREYEYKKAKITTYNWLEARRIDGDLYRVFDVTFTAYDEADVGKSEKSERVQKNSRGRAAFSLEDVLAFMKAFEDKNINDSTIDFATRPAQTALHYSRLQPKSLGLLVA